LEVNDVDATAAFTGRQLGAPGRGVERLGHVDVVHDPPRLEVRQVAGYQVITDGEVRPVIESTTTGSQSHRLVRMTSPQTGLLPGWESRPVGIEELALAYLRESVAPKPPTLTGVSR
jgi:hypothetical protein